MKILGIDPGSRNAGFALIEKSHRKFNYIVSGTLTFNTKLDFVDRIGDIYDSCEKLIHELQPDAVSIESLIYVKSPTALMKLAQARGAMIAAIMKNYKGKLFEYSPNLVKSSVCGHGHAGNDGSHRIRFSRRLCRDRRGQFQASCAAVG